jgi:hypothetical protein
MKVQGEQVQSGSPKSSGIPHFDKRLDITSQLSYIHILNLKISIYGWRALARGLAIAKNLDCLKINLCDLDRDAIAALADGLKSN